MLSVPFALVGGVFLQYLLGYPMTTAVIIGYIALFAVAIQTGIIMIIFIRQALARKAANESYMDAVIDGSVLRLRPKLMTVACTVLSLLPIMVSTGPGMEIMKPIATPTIGGMISSTIYVLFLIPCLFAIGEDIRRMRKKKMIVANDPLPFARPDAIRRRTLRSALPLFLAAILALTSANPTRAAVAAAPPPPNPEALLPPGPEKAVILEDCQDCHSLNMVTRHGGSLEGWTSRLVRMIRSGSMITRDQIPALAAYLAKALPERPRPEPPKR
jgi:hypothetical protein